MLLRLTPSFDSSILYSINLNYIFKKLISEYSALDVVATTKARQILKWFEAGRGLKRYFKTVGLASVDFEIQVSLSHSLLFEPFILFILRVHTQSDFIEGLTESSILIITFWFF